MNYWILIAILVTLILQGLWTLVCISFGTYVAQRAAEHSDVVRAASDIRRRRSI